MRAACRHRATAGQVIQAVPGVVKLAQDAGLQPVQKRVQLGVVGTVILRIDVPDQCPCLPTGRAIRSLPHGIEVASPEHFVKSRLGQGVRYEIYSRRAYLSCP